jgi:hypothetical protein
MLTVTFDPEAIRGSIDLWKLAIDGKIPAKPEFALHFIQRRPAILDNYERACGSWLMFLHGAVPMPEDRPEFEKLIAEIEEFRGWTKAEIKKIDDLAMQEAVQAGIDELIAKDPETARKLGKYFGKKRK